MGFGAIAESAYLPALRLLDVAVDAIAEPVPARLEAAKRLAPSARLYNDLDVLLSCEKDLDALIVCSPPKYHAGAILSGIRAGLHVLCEKPLTLDPQELTVIQAESIARNVCVYSVNNWAFSPQWSYFLNVAASGRLGAILHAEIRVLRMKPSVSALPGGWRKDPAISGGGILVDHGWHSFYLLRRLLGPELMLARAVLSVDGAVDEVAAVLLKTAGASGAIYLSWRASERSNFVFVAGACGTAELRDNALIVKADGAEETTCFQEKLSEGSAHPDWLAAMWPAFEEECAGRRRGENLAEASFCLAMIRQALHD